MDPAVREVLDRGDFETQPGDDPKDPSTSWSLTLDVASVSATAHAAPWQTLGWEAIVVYEMHAKRFTDIDAGTLSPLDIVADELAPACRRGGPGYLRGLPVTALELLPVHEFKLTASWGYNPAFFFAIDGFYGGSMALARMVDASHRAGRGVFLDLVYNHMNDSPLTQIAIDVYRNGDAWGDRINHDHPMVKEFFRQAIVYTWRTFGLDGFRFDDTKTILNNNGWDFLSKVHGAVRGAADAEGRHWPYCVAENDQDGRQWNLSNPAWSVLDGQWAYDQSWTGSATSRTIRGTRRPTTWGASRAGWTSPRRDGAGSISRPRVMPRVTTGSASRTPATSGSPPGPLRPGVPVGQGDRDRGADCLAGCPCFSWARRWARPGRSRSTTTGRSSIPQVHDLPAGVGHRPDRVLAWFRSLMGLRNDPIKGLRGNDSIQVVRTGRRTVAFTCGGGQSLFAVVTFGTPDQRQDSSWLGLPNGSPYKEIFNSSWPASGSSRSPSTPTADTTAQIFSGQVLNLPYVGAVVLERR